MNCAICGVPFPHRAINCPGCGVPRPVFSPTWLDPVPERAPTSFREVILTLHSVKMGGDGLPDAPDAACKRACTFTMVLPAAVNVTRQVFAVEGPIYRPTGDRTRTSERTVGRRADRAIHRAVARSLSRPSTVKATRSRVGRRVRSVVRKTKEAVHHASP
jgi:hypothetical protein